MSQKEVLSSKEIVGFTFPKRTDRVQHVQKDIYATDSAIINIKTGKIHAHDIKFWPSVITPLPNYNNTGSSQIIFDSPIYYVVSCAKESNQIIVTCDIVGDTVTKVTTVLDCVGSCICCFGHKNKIIIQEYGVMPRIRIFDFIPFIDDSLNKIAEIRGEVINIMQYLVIASANLLTIYDVESNTEIGTITVQCAKIADFRNSTVIAENIIVLNYKVGQVDQSEVHIIRDKVIKNACVMYDKCGNLYSKRVLVPCGHRKLCENCIEHGEVTKCPICKEKVTDVIKLVN